MFVRFQVHIHSQYQLILNIRRLKCVTTTNMLVFLSACLSCLAVCLSVSQTSIDDSQWKYRATLEFKSSGCVASNNINYDSSLSFSVSVKVIPKSSGTCLNLTQSYCFKPICQGVINEIASKQCVRGQQIKLLQSSASVRGSYTNI